MKIRKIKNVTIKDDLVYKTNNKPLKDIFEYLDSRNFNMHPKVIDENEKVITFKYEEEKGKASTFDLSRSASLLHNSTVYFKDVSTKKYKEIYNKLIDNVDYMKEVYNKLIFNIDKEIYPSPSAYLFSRNYSLFISNLLYIEKELNAYYRLVKDKTKERVCLCHGNLRSDNIFKSDDIVLTGWDKYVTDSPVLDIYLLYKNEYDNIDFNEFLKKYFENFNYSNEEKVLLKILISMPLDLEYKGSEVNKIKDINKCLNYINKSNELIKSGVFD